MVASSGSPLANANVGLYKSGEVCARARTNGSGQADIIISPSSPDWLYVAVNAQDKLSATDGCRITTGTPQPYLTVQGFAVVDAGNGRLDPGETVDLFATLRNIGNARATPVRGTLREASSFVTASDSISDYGAMNATDTARGDRYQLTAAANTPPGSEIQFTPHVTADQGFWNPTFALTVGMPQ